MSNHHRRIFKTPLRNTEAEADADALKLVAILTVHAPELLGDLEPLSMPSATTPKKPRPEGREVPGGAAMRKKAIA